MPAFHHGSEVETVRRAGFECRFYDGRDGINPDQEELESLVGEGTRGLYLIHALGRTHDPLRWRRWCDERGLYLLEDAAQAWLSGRDGTPAGSAGDVAIFCFYKVAPMPDAAALRTAAPIALPNPMPRAPGSLRSLARLTRDELSHRTRRLAGLRGRAKDAHRRDEVPERDFGAGPNPRRPARASLYLSRRIDGEATAAARRRNYAYLAERLSEFRPAALAGIDSSESPLVFPVETGDKRGLLDHLAGNRIIDGKLWTVPHPSLPAERFPRAAAMRDRLVGLPVHQRLRENDLERIAAVAGPWLAAGRGRAGG
jgi:dTDP-4-amino-4,6-dideoxygalactose transaminase